MFIYSEVCCQEACCSIFCMLRCRANSQASQALIYGWSTAAESTAVFGTGAARLGREIGVSALSCGFANNSGFIAARAHISASDGMVEQFHRYLVCPFLSPSFPGSWSTQRITYLHQLCYSSKALGLGCCFKRPESKSIDFQCRAEI